MGGGNLVVVGGNCVALGGYTMNQIKILLDKSSVRQKSYKKKVCGHQRKRAYNRLDQYLPKKKSGQNHGHYVSEPSLFNTYIKKKVFIHIFLHGICDF